MVVITPSIYLQSIMCVVGCVGFAMMFNIRGRNLVSSGVGALLCWTVYSVVYSMNGQHFVSVVLASAAAGFFARIMARVNKSPATIVLTASIFPMIPGSHLYYMMYCLMMDMPEDSKSEGILVLLSCTGIATGLIITEVCYKYIGELLRLGAK